MDATVTTAYTLLLTQKEVDELIAAANFCISHCYSIDTTISRWHSLVLSELSDVLNSPLEQ